ncbi:MAG: MogA/MoaB family molybdenum cofactor biosynthesis protein [Methanobacterium sp.]|nr:MogA/MoaB family molybdenum cofactor biosynthesis protein [Methanobacterium sp.]
MKSKSMEEHKKNVPKSIKFAVITLSDSKYKDFLENKTTDISGNLIIDSLKKYELVFYSVIPDDPELLLLTVEDIIKKHGADVIITTGGTGIGVRDITIETIKPIMEKEINGFGEIFRYESYKELGTGAILSRATAGIYKNTLIILLPGSPNAVNTGLKIITPELKHLVKHVHGG